ncbi:hypothetical protein KR009_004196 [Drosophila setifemur]|nr:hypothetical protein KR009_004196 [Drosophila setifemur]
MSGSRLRSWDILISFGGSGNRSDISRASSTDNSSDFESNASSVSNASSNLSESYFQQSQESLRSVQDNHSSFNSHQSLESPEAVQDNGNSDHSSIYSQGSPESLQDNDDSVQDNGESSRGSYHSQDDSNRNQSMDDTDGIDLSTGDRPGEVLQLRSLSINVSQMEADIDRINRYCEDVVAQIGVGLPSTSTPTIVRGRRRPPTPHPHPVEVIDLSQLELASARSARNRSPDEVIDLCTPDRVYPIRHRNNRLDNRPSCSRNTRRRTVDNSTSYVDLDNFSPPKRVRPSDLEQSQREGSYKCPVCLEEVRRREPVSTKCGHVFCRECITSAISSTHKCPMCNKKLTIRQFFRIYL